MSQKGQKNQCPLIGAYTKENLKKTLIAALAHDIEKIFRGCYKPGSMMYPDRTKVKEFLEALFGKSDNRVEELFDRIKGKTTKDLVKSVRDDNSLLNLLFLRSSVDGVLQQGEYTQIDAGECKRRYDDVVAGGTRVIEKMFVSGEAPNRNYHLNQLRVFESLRASDDEVGVMYFLPYRSGGIRIHTITGEFVRRIVEKSGKTSERFLHRDVATFKFLEDLWGKDPESKGKPFGHLLTTLELLKFASENLDDLDYLFYRDIRLYGLISRPENAGGPSIQLGIHTALGAMIQAVRWKTRPKTVSGQKVAVIHFSLFDADEIITGLPYTFEPQESGFLKRVRGVSALLYAYTLAVVREIVRRYEQMLEPYYRFFAFIPTVSEALMLLAETHYNKALEVLSELAGKVMKVELVLGEKTRSIDIPFKVRLISERIDENNKKAIRDVPIKELIEDDKRWIEREDFHEIFFRPVQSSGNSRIAMAKRLRIDRIKQKTKALIVGTVEKNGKLYPMVYALNAKNDGYELVQIVEYDETINEKPKDPVILIAPVKYENGRVRPKREYELLKERLEIAKEVDKKWNLGKDPLGTYGMAFLPASLPIDLEDIYGEGRVLHLRFVFDDPIEAMKKIEKRIQNPQLVKRKKTPMVYAGLIYEHVSLMSSFILPHLLAPLNPLPLYVTRNEAYFLAKPKGLGDDILDLEEFLEAVEEADYQLRIIVDDENVKNPVYRVKAKNDAYVDGKKPAVVAFGIELKPKEFVKALKLSKSIEKNDVGRFKRYGGLLRKKLVTGEEIDREFLAKLSESIMRNGLRKYAPLRDLVVDTLALLMLPDVQQVKELRPWRTLIGAINAFLNVLETNGNVTESIYQLFVAAQRVGKLREVSEAINLVDPEGTRKRLEMIKKEAYAVILKNMLSKAGVKPVKGTIHDRKTLVKIIAIASRLAELRLQE